MRRNTTPLLLLVTVSACAADVSATSDADAALCADAVAHVEACVGEAPVANVCDASSAEQLLGMSCEQLDDAKADGIFSDTLCFFGFDSYCEAPEPVRHTLSGTVQDWDTLETVQGAVVQITSGGQTSSTVSGPDGVFSFAGLETGTYQVVLLFDGVPQDHRTFEVDGTMSILLFVGSPY